ncbi:MAG: hypothetical protein HZA59_13850 [Hydrogenophilales bacterium]|nr:hypothetical protein [Hydrogenophilales bacterium]
MIGSHYATIFLALLVGVSHTASGEPSARGEIAFPPAARQEVLKRFPSLKGELGFAQGDIDRDGVQDIAAIVLYVEKETDMESIVVLKGKAGGDYSLIAESAPFEPHMRRSESIRVKRNSLYVAAGGGTYTEYAGTTYQFKSYSGRMLLVGLEFERGEIGGDASEHISANFLTNKMIERRIKDQKKTITYRSLRGRHATPIEKFALDAAVDATALE